MKSWLKPIILFLVALGALGSVVMLSGVVPVSASSGHWPITVWFLEFSMKRSISTHSLNLEAPYLNNPDMIQRGAGHYEIGCRQCHGAILKNGFLGRLTTPKAPYLLPKIKEWGPEELFQIIKHGIKLSAMPAWPTLERDDEIWSMVSFLLKLPKLKEGDYENLVHAPGSEKISSIILRSCANCHGVDGNGRKNGAFPKLAGQNQEYLENALHAYAEGKRHSGTMQFVASSLKDEMIHELARHFSKQKRKKTPSGITLFRAERRAMIKRGSLIAKKGIPDQRVAACIGCHGPNKFGLTKKPYFPDLRGQPYIYLKNQLELFMQGKRGGSNHVTLMHKAVTELTPSQIKDVALYYESLLEE